jgi:hypothetical protein
MPTCWLPVQAEVHILIKSKQHLLTEFRVLNLQGNALQPVYGDSCNGVVGVQHFFA